MSRLLELLFFYSKISKYPLQLGCTSCPVQSTHAARLLAFPLPSSLQCKFHLPFLPVSRCLPWRGWMDGWLPVSDKALFLLDSQCSCRTAPAESRPLPTWSHWQDHPGNLQFIGSYACSPSSMLGTPLTDTITTPRIETTPQFRRIGKTIRLVRWDIRNWIIEDARYPSFTILGDTQVVGSKRKPHVLVTSIDIHIHTIRP